MPLWRSRRLATTGACQQPKRVNNAHRPPALDLHTYANITRYFYDVDMQSRILVLPRISLRAENITF